VDRRSLARRLERVAPFDTPRVDLEQYPTPADVAASLLHRAALDGDLDRPVVDLGAGTGRLAIGAALIGAPAVGVEIDRDALRVARRNERRVCGASGEVAWIHGDATRPAVELDGTTVVTNPPFGAQAASQGDRGFLAAAADAAVSWSLHNAGSREFAESFAADRGGTVTAAFAVELALDRQFAFHTADTRRIDALAVRIEWDEG
jgi:putative methylase